MIVVIDTNVWVSGLQSARRRGPPTLALEKALAEDVVATCNEIEAEIVRVLTEKFHWERHRVIAAMHSVMARSIRVDIRGTVQACRDSSDDVFLECAELAEAHLLIAGDNDLLSLGSYKGTHIITPAEYVTLPYSRSQT